ncbi:MAG: hypothetical protein R3E32_15365 [Chitinophagales bacterium]
MNLLRCPLFILACFLFIFNQFLESQQIFLPYIHAYLDDLLCFPIVLTIILFLLREIYQNPNYRFTPLQIVFALAYFSLAFEVVLPYFSANYRGDILDVVAYVVGAVIFWKWMQKTGDS